MCDVLAADDTSARWSQRIRNRLDEMREEHAWVHAEGPTLLSQSPSGAEWWTFAGTRANATLAGELSRLGGCVSIAAQVAVLESSPQRWGHDARGDIRHTAPDGSIGLVPEKGSPLKSVPFVPGTFLGRK
jgi:hypothetical protein